MKLPRSRASRRGRIEVIPMIDVMFFLLATFLLASLSLQHLNSLPVNLPQGRAVKGAPSAPITLTITRTNRIYLNKRAVSLDQLTRVLKPMLSKAHATSMIVAADRDAREGTVVRAMLAARKAGMQHFLIAIHKP